MNFMQAVKAMKEGKKVRRSRWGDQLCIFMNIPEDTIKQGKPKCEESNPKEFRGYIIDFEATDWEIVEDKKTLSDEYMVVDLPSYKGNVYLEDKVKQFIKDIKEDMKETFPTPSIQDLICDKINKRAGERLIENV